jgi:hypothetical protein
VCELEHVAESGEWLESPAGMVARDALGERERDRPVERSVHQQHRAIDAVELLPECASSDDASLIGILVIIDLIIVIVRLL